MEKSRLEIKVGLFVFIGLVLLAVLLIQFSKGTSLFRGTYELHLHAGNVGGLKQRAGVLLAGVQVGSVSEIKLADDGKSVTILLRIYNQNPDLPRRAVRHRAVRLSRRPVCFRHSHAPTALPVLTNGEEVHCQEPFNLQEVARSTAGFIQRIDETAKKLDDAVTDLRRLVLNEQTLTNFAVGHQQHCARFPNRRWARSSDINTLVATNSAQVNLAVSNLVFFSQELHRLAGSAQTCWPPTARKSPRR